MIRKDISRSDGFSKMSADAQVIFCLLIPHFNAHGKMNGSPFFIKGEVVPKIERLTVESIGACLQEISENTNVKWYESGGLKYLQSLNFCQHQELRQDRVGRDEIPSYSATITESLPDNSGSIPGLLRLEVEGEGEVKGEVKGTPCSTGKPKKAKEFEPEGWDTFWSAYPNKKSKQTALRSFRKLSPTPELLETILKALGVHKQQDSWVKDGGQFIPHPATWLNGRRWEDEVQASTGRIIGSQTNDKYHDSQIR